MFIFATYAVTFAVAWGLSWWVHAHPLQVKAAEQKAMMALNRVVSDIKDDVTGHKGP